MKKRMIQIFAIAVSLSLLVACSEKASPATGGSEGELSKILNIATTGETTVLSPLYMVSVNFPTSKLLYEGLVKYVDGNIQPVLATDWSFSEDKTELTFNLREGVSFHDGEPWNANALKANLDYMKTNPAFGALPAINSFIEVQIIDEFTATIVYANPYFAYMTDFCWPDVGVMVSPKQITQGDYQTVNGYAGTGPYIYNTYTAGVSTTFMPNENYWGEKPYYSEIVAKYIPESASRIQAFKAGEIDLLYGAAQMTYEEYNQVIALEGMEGKFAPAGSTVRNIVTNMNGHLSDLSVRQAVAYAIDKTSLSEDLMYGYEPVTDTYMVEGSAYDDFSRNTDYSYNKEKANELLDKASWMMNEETGIREKDGQPLNLLLTYIQDEGGTKAIVTLIKSQLAEVGIKIETKAQEQMEWMTDYMNPQGFDITVFYGYYNYAMPNCWFTPMSLYTAHTVSFGVHNEAEKFANYIEEFKTSGDDEQVSETFEYLINYTLDQAWDIPLTEQMDMIVYNADKISDYNFISDYQFLDVSSIVPAQ